MDTVRGGERRAGYRAAFALALAAGVGAWACWFIADRNAEARVARVEADVRTAFHEGPETAATWVDLMRWNDLRGALATCSAPGEIMMRGGRRACRVPLWVARPPSAGH